MKDIRIVWNLTNKCPFNCSFCAAAANTKEDPNTEYKQKILNSILTYGKNVSIDFSGGDPLSTQDNIKVIKKAGLQLEKNNISVSTTGLSLSKLTDDEIKTISGNYELTYDFPTKFSLLDKRNAQYNRLNMEQAKRIKQLGLNLNIFVPVQNMNNEIIDELTNNLCDLNPNSIAMIRLMPVGSLDIKNKQDFDEIKIYNTIVEMLQNKGYQNQVKPTCAMRALLGKKKACNMVSDKFGVDHLGNLFSCIWASDIMTDNNPFCLGNLTKTPLKDLIKSSSKNTMSETNNCKVYDFLKQ